MVTINWDPVPHIGPVPINWYGLGWGAAFLTALWLVRRWAPAMRFSREQVENLALWSLAGAFIGARLYFIAQNDPGAYVREPWCILMVWEGGLAFFGGLFGAILAAFISARRQGMPFARAADLFAPAIPIAAAIGRIPCWLAGMDYGTPTTLPWSVVYTHPSSYAPNDGVPRHPVQLYELLGDLAIVGLLLKMRGRLREGNLFVLYLVLFSVLRFLLFFVRGDVPIVALGLTNGHWTALVLFTVALALLMSRTTNPAIARQPANRGSGQSNRSRPRGIRPRDAARLRHRPPANIPMDRATGSDAGATAPLAARRCATCRPREQTLR